MSDSLHQPDLDFDGTDAELQLRLRWAANEAAFRRECARVNTPEMLTVRWIHGWKMTTEDDLRWWNGQPAYMRTRFTHFFEQIRRDYGNGPLPLYCTMPDFWEIWNLHEAEIERRCETEERYVEEWAQAIREAFAKHQPCPFDVSGADPAIRWEMEHRLERAIRLAGIPIECLQPQPSEPHETTRRKRIRRDR